MERSVAMQKWIKQFIIVLLVAFAVFYLYTRPEAAAGVVKIIPRFVDSLGVFFTELARP